MARAAPEAVKELAELIYGVHADAAEMRERPELFRARMEGVRAANHRWSMWLQRQGYTPEQALTIIAMDMAKQ